MPNKSLLSPLIARALTILLFGLVLASAAKFARILLPQPVATLVDFDAFHLAGRMVWEGTIDQAYQWTIFFQREKELGKEIFMPWTYPPPFNLILAPLALLPLPIAYLLFIGPTLVGYLWVLRRLAGPHLPFALVAASPAVIMAIRCGQNGLLTATLLGLLAIGLLGQKRWSGAPLGLMILKPHLAITLSVATLLQQRWRVLVVATLTCAVVIALCTVLLGANIWTAFLNATREAKVFMTEGYYPLYRMVSVYAALKSLGFAPSLALAGQIAVAVATLGLVARAALDRLALRDSLGLAVITAPFITPYAYDYDLCLLGIGLALLGPSIERLLSEREQTIVLILSVIGCGVGLVQNIRSDMFDDLHPGYSAKLASLGAWPILCAIALIAYKLWRAQHAPPPLVIAGPAELVTRD